MTMQHKEAHTSSRREAAGRTPQQWGRLAASEKLSALSRGPSQLGLCAHLFTAGCFQIIQLSINFIKVLLFTSLESTRHSLDAHYFVKCSWVFISKSSIKTVMNIVILRNFSNTLPSPKLGQNAKS